MPQDYYDSLQVFDHIANLLDDNKATLGLRYIARLDENLLPQYPAVLVSLETPTLREWHTTAQFLVRFNLDIWIFHALLTVGKAIRSRKDIELATEVRKLLHTDLSLGGHIVSGWVDGEYPGRTTRVVGGKASSVVTTRLTWTGENRVPHNLS